MKGAKKKDKKPNKTISTSKHGVFSKGQQKRDDNIAYEQFNVDWENLGKDPQSNKPVSYRSPTNEMIVINRLVNCCR